MPQFAPMSYLLLFFVLTLVYFFVYLSIWWAKKAPFWIKSPKIVD
uniref:ATP synthase F0 subunit 8 n=1 Tax=Thyasira tokunagai TaxID=3055801 RepID=A0AB39CC52_9BIVA